MLYLILLLPAALAVCCCVLRPDGGRARSAALLAAINQAISELDAEGELSRISEKYFGKDISRATAE